MIALKNNPQAQLSDATIRKGKINRHLLKENIEYMILSAAAVIYFIVFHYLPMIGVVIAFKHYRYSEGIFGSKWAGLNNFKFFFTSQDAFRITRNTVLYGIGFIIIGIIVSVIVAVLINEIRSRACIKFYQTTMLLPYFLSWVIVAFLVYIMLDPVLGQANSLLKIFGIEAVSWYSEPKYWPVILTYVNMWKTVGINSTIYYASILSIDREQYEAACIDGASRFKQAIHITIPSLVPLMIILSILALGNIFRGDIGLFFQVPRNVGVLYPTTDVIDTYVYRGLKTDDLSVTAAVGLFQSFVGLIMVLLSNYIVKKIDAEKCMF